MIDDKLEYGFATPVSLPFDRAIETVKEYLKDEGFGVLCEIDVRKTLKEKIGEEFRPYVILGACNPHLAHRALSAEPQLGLLLPCNVVVQQGEGTTVVSAIDAKKMMGFVNNDTLAEVAEDANARLRRVLERIAKS